jgi:hypothetical protein
MDAHFDSLKLMIGALIIVRGLRSDLRIDPSPTAAAFRHLVGHDSYGVPADGRATIRSSQH